MDECDPNRRARANSEAVRIVPNLTRIVFNEVDGRLQCRVTDEAKLLEILDARRYHLDLTDDGGTPYRASARQKVAL